MPMVGALLVVKELMTIDELKIALAKRFSKKFSQAVVDGNVTAVERAYKELRSA